MRLLLPMHGNALWLFASYRSWPDPRYPTNPLGTLCRTQHSSQPCAEWVQLGLCSSCLQLAGS